MVKQIMPSEDPPIVCIAVAVQGLRYCRKTIGGLPTVISSYAIVLAASCTARRFVNFLFFKLEASNEILFNLMACMKS